MNENLYAIQYRLSQNDTRALKELYDHFGNKLLQLANAIVHSREMAEEIVEDVFIKIWEKRGDFMYVENLKWYLYVTAKNISCNYLRKYGNKKILSLEEVSLPQFQIDVTPEDLMMTGEIIARINRAINDLPPKCRLIFKLVKEDKLKYKEVAALLNISAKTVENQIGIALKKLYAATYFQIPAASKSLIFDR